MFDYVSACICMWVYNISPFNSNLYTWRTVYYHSLFHMLVNKLLELNEVLIHLFVAVSLRINTILTQ